MLSQEIHKLKLFSKSWWNASNISFCLGWFANYEFNVQWTLESVLTA